MGGIELKIGTYKGGLWFDSSEDFYNDGKGWGLKLALRWGSMTCPIKKFWSKKTRWEDPWFTIHSSWVVGPYISIAFNKYGAYFGLKDNGWGLNNILIFSASWRKTRLD